MVSRAPFQPSHVLQVHMVQVELQNSVRKDIFLQRPTVLLTQYNILLQLCIHQKQNSSRSLTMQVKQYGPYLNDLKHMV